MEEVFNFLIYLSDDLLGTQISKEKAKQYNVVLFLALLFLFI
jgi:hypothetical protein